MNPWNDIWTLKRVSGENPRKTCKHHTERSQLRLEPELSHCKVRALTTTPPRISEFKIHLYNKRWNSLLTHLMVIMSRKRFAQIQNFWTRSTMFWETQKLSQPNKFRWYGGSFVYSKTKSWWTKSVPFWSRSFLCSTGQERFLQGRSCDDLTHTREW